MNFKIFPYEIASDGRKKPLLTDWANQASNDPLVHEQWRQFFGPRIAGYGLPTGKINGVWALDIDQKDGKSGFETLHTMGVTHLPETMWQATPSGGMHLLFNCNQDIHYPTSVNTDTKIDTRGDGGFIWLYNLQMLPAIDAPMWVWGAIKKTNKTKERGEIDPSTIVPMDPLQALEKFNTCIDAVRNAAQGERNHNLNVQAYLVGQIVASGAVSKEYAFEQLKLAAMYSGLPEREAYATIMSGLGGGETNPITHPFGVTPPEPAFKIPEPPVIIPRARWTPTKGNINLLKDYTKLKKPQLFKDWSTEDLHLTSAIGGVGKTTIKLFESLCLALGEPFLGFPCLQPGRTVFIVGEDSEAKIWAMLGRMLEQLGIMEQPHKLQAVLDNIYIKRAKDLCLVETDPRTKGFKISSDALEKLGEVIADLKPKHIVFDPLGMFQGPEAGGNDMATAMMKTLQEVQELSDACIDLVNHIGKDSHSKKDTSQFSGRGATAVANHSRVVRTYLKLNENEYKEFTGEELGDNTAIYCVISKFSDGSPLLDKPFIILRSGYVFERKEIIKATTQEINTSMADKKSKVYQFFKAQRGAIPEKQVTSHFIMAEDRLNKTECKAIITMLQLEGVIEEVHGDVTIDKTWWQVKS